MIIIMLFLLTNFQQKLKLEMFHGTIKILFYVSWSSHKDFPFLSIKAPKSKYYSASEWSAYTKSHFKENAKMFSKNLTTQENITISRPKENCKTYTKKKISNRKLN